MCAAEMKMINEKLMTIKGFTINQQMKTFSFVQNE